MFHHCHSGEKQGKPEKQVPIRETSGDKMTKCNMSCQTERGVSGKSDEIGKSQSLVSNHADHSSFSTNTLNVLGEGIKSHPRTLHHSSINLKLLQNNKFILKIPEPQMNQQILISCLMFYLE